MKPINFKLWKWEYRIYDLSEPCRADFLEEYRSGIWEVVTRKHEKEIPFEFIESMGIAGHYALLRRPRK